MASAYGEGAAALARRIAEDFDGEDQRRTRAAGGTHQLLHDARRGHRTQSPSEIIRMIKIMITFGHQLSRISSIKAAMVATAMTATNIDPSPCLCSSFQRS